MAMTTSILCDGCQTTLDPKKPDSMWHGKLPLPNPAPPLTDADKQAKKGREKYSIDHAVLCKGCTEKLGDFLASLGVQTEQK